MRAYLYVLQVEKVLMLSFCVDNQHGRYHDSSPVRCCREDGELSVSVRDYMEILESILQYPISYFGSQGSI